MGLSFGPGWNLKAGDDNTVEFKAGGSKTFPHSVEHVILRGEVAVVLLNAANGSRNVYGVNARKGKQVWQIEPFPPPNQGPYERMALGDDQDEVALKGPGAGRIRVVGVNGKLVAKTAPSGPKKP